ncbi:hypothetical protein A8L34_01250 [Bacillus sp. FJAT-27264]|uniref:hypothetical protein n=1 Tax=Paenibacillus sp. (strain DSM 101736 / FJAT-27264) TaxID=1850362 RepID=UPI000807F101|nr:hypothetical protein [Bacillus sp. FJAT-27264]OBZ18244.1 hypothetical protein A8L34_01250 [Bacillus sp. FJAT-27264]
MKLINKETDMLAKYLGFIGSEINMYKFFWRITKYDPTNRIKGVYKNEEWTSISEVGKVFSAEKFLLEHYLETESLYVTAINLIMNENNLNTIQVVELEKYYFDVEKAEFHSIYTDDWKNSSRYNSLCKRENYWNIYDRRYLSLS